MDWPEPTKTEINKATKLVLSRLKDPTKAAKRLLDFHNPDGDYAGFTFLDDFQGNPNEIDKADFFSVSLLNVTAKTSAVRLILEQGKARNGLVRSLSAVSQTWNLAKASAMQLETAAAFYTDLKAVLGKNPWVVTSKLAARKRPNLIPVRDKVVVNELGLSNRDFRTDWLVFQQLLKNNDVEKKLEIAVQSAVELDGRMAKLGQLPMLRKLDTLIWMR